MKNNTLTESQALVVREMIMDSMRSVYIDAGLLPADNFEHLAGVIADRIIKNTQMSLMQKAVFTKIVEKPKKPRIKKVTKKKKNGK